MGILSFIWHTGRDSNPQPSEPESDALSIEPPVHALQPSHYSKLSPFCKGGTWKISRHRSRFFAETVVFPGKL